MTPNPSGRQLTFPNELLTEIFLYSWAIQNKTDFWGGHRVEFALSQVCRVWRFITLQNPILWTTLVVTESGPLYRRSNIQLYLDRSKNLPLDLRFSKLEWLEEVEQLMNVLETQAERWGSLSVTSSNRESLLFFYGNLEEVNVPALQRFTIFLHKDPPEYSNNIVFVPGAPQLEEVALYGLGFNRCKPPLGAVKKLTLYGGHEWDTRLEGDDAEFYLQDAFDELKLLEEMYLYNRPIDVGWSGAAAERNLPRLRKLAFIEPDHGYTNYNPLCVFEAMLTPNLAELHLVGWFEYVELFEFLIAHSDPPRLSSVELLDMRPMEMDEVETDLQIGFINQVPGIRHLIANSAYLEAFIASVASQEGGSEKANLWIDLGTLTFDHAVEEAEIPENQEPEPELEGVAVKTLCMFVEKRAGGGYPLKVVRLSREFINQIKGYRLEWLKEKVLVEVYEDAELIRFEEMVEED